MTAQLWVFAGPNGAGKSTLVGQYVRGRIPVINPDEIARDPAAPVQATASRLLEAGRPAIQMPPHSRRE